MLESEHDAFLETEFYRIEQYEDSKAAEDILRFRLLTPIPITWAVIAGEILHNLRSAVAHLAWELARLHHDPPPNDTEFPLFIDSSKFQTTGKYMIRGMSQGIQSAIETAQPYQRKNIFEKVGLFLKEDDPEQHPLWLLHRLNVVDKHRLLHVGVSTITSSTSWEAVTGQAVDFRSIMTRFGPLEDGAEVGRVGIGPLGRRPKMNQDFDFVVGIAFNEGTPASGDHYTIVLRYILYGVERLLQLFSSEFLKSASPVCAPKSLLGPARSRRY